MRNAIACVSCRVSKRQCISIDDKPPCERCKTYGRSESCRFPLPGTSAQHRLSKQMRRADAAQRVASGAGAASIHSSSPLPFRTPPGSGRSGSDGLSPHKVTMLGCARSNSVGDGVPKVDLRKINPFKLFTDDVKNSYLRCSYKWSFHHIPTLLQNVRSESLDIWVMWSILALSIRFVQEPPLPFATTIEASNAYAAHARQLLQPAVESPSLSRLQALLMITGHSWGAGDGARAWMYLGTAVRMVQVLNLCEDEPLHFARIPTKDEFIHAEERRRAAWTCFLMDSLLSGGKGRKRSLSSDDMRIQLPCEKDFFYFGEAVKCEWMNGKLMTASESTYPTGTLGIVAHSMRAADFWGDVARWACSSVMTEELPWNQASQYQRLTQRIEHWKVSLPQRLHYSRFLLHAHSATDQGQAYIYMWAIYFMAKLFLHRAYLPVLGLNHDQDLSQSTVRQETQGTPKEWGFWRKHSRQELFATAATVCDMMEEMRTFGVFFLRGCVPWIGFTIYTAVGVMLYCYNFPLADDDPEVVSRAKSLVMNGCSFLREMKAWPMAGTWFETIKRMQAYYRKLKSKGNDGVTSDERENLKNSLVDYGHLQSPPADPTPQPSGISQSGNSSNGPSPAGTTPLDYLTAVAQQIESPRPVQVPQRPSAVAGASTITDANGLVLQSPPATGMTGALGVPVDGANGGWGAPLPAADDVLWDVTNPFDFAYDWNSADFDAVMADATQGFWADFPGEAAFG